MWATPLIDSGDRADASLFLVNGSCLVVSKSSLVCHNIATNQVQRSSKGNSLKNSAVVAYPPHVVFLHRRKGESSEYIQRRSTNDASTYSHDLKTAAYGKVVAMVPAEDILYIVAEKAIYVTRFDNFGHHYPLTYPYPPGTPTLSDLFQNPRFLNAEHNGLICMGGNTTFVLFKVEPKEMKLVAKEISSNPWLCCSLVDRFVAISDGNSVIILNYTNACTRTLEKIPGITALLIDQHSPNYIYMASSTHIHIFDLHEKKIVASSAFTVPDIFQSKNTAISRIFKQESYILCFTVEGLLLVFDNQLTLCGVANIGVVISVSEVNADQIAMLVKPKRATKLNQRKSLLTLTTADTRGAKLRVWNAKVFALQCKSKPLPIFMEDPPLPPTKEGYVYIKKDNKFKQKYLRLFNNVLFEYKDADDNIPTTSYRLYPDSDNKTISEIGEENSKGKVYSLHLKKGKLHVIWKTGEERSWIESIGRAASKNNTEMWKLDADPLLMSHQLDSGRSAKVYAGVYNNQRVAIKQYHSKWEYNKEVNFTSMLKHPCIVPLLGCIHARHHEYTLLQPLIPGGTLEKALSCLDWLTWGAYCRLMLDVALAMQYLHSFRENGISKPIIHVDLHANNILINSKDPAEFTPMGLVSDFGFATDKELNEHTERGRKEGLPPESVITTKWDVYRFGVLLGYVASGGWLLYTDEDGSEGFLVKLFLQDPQFDIPQPILELISDCVLDDMDKRPTFNDIVLRLNKIIMQLSAEKRLNQHVAIQKDVAAPEPIKFERQGGRIHLASSIMHDICATVSSQQRSNKIVVLYGSRGSGLTSLLEVTSHYMKLSRYFPCCGKWSTSSSYMPLQVITKALAKCISSFNEEQRVLFETKVATQLKIDDILNIKSPCSQEERSAMLCRLVTRICTEVVPLAIILDNLEHADTLTISLLQELMRQVSRRKLVVIVATHDSNKLSMVRYTSVYPQEMQLLNSLFLIKRAAPYVTINIPPLTVDLTSRILCDYGITLQQREVANALVATTKGNPLMIHKTLQYLHEHGHITYNEISKSWVVNLDFISEHSVEGAMFQPLELQVASLFLGPFTVDGVAAAMACIDKAHDIKAHVKKVQAVFTQAHEYNIIERDGIFFFTKTNTLASSVSKEQILIFRNAIIKSCQHILQQHKNAITKESDPKIQHAFVEMVRQKLLLSDDVKEDAKTMATQCYQAGTYMLNMGYMNVALELYEKAFELMNLLSSGSYLLNELVLDISIALILTLVIMGSIDTAQERMSLLNGRLPSEVHGAKHLDPPLAKRQARFYALKSLLHFLKGEYQQVTHPALSCLYTIFPDAQSSIEHIDLVEASQKILDNENKIIQKQNTPTNTLVSPSAFPIVDEVRSDNDYQLVEQTLLTSMIATCTCLKISSKPMPQFTTLTFDIAVRSNTKLETGENPFAVHFFGRILKTKYKSSPASNICRLAREIYKKNTADRFTADCALALACGYSFTKVFGSYLRPYFTTAMSIAYSTNNALLLNQAVMLYVTYLFASGTKFENIIPEIVNCLEYLSKFSDPRSLRTNQLLSVIRSNGHDFFTSEVANVDLLITSDTIAKCMDDECSLLTLLEALLQCRRFALFDDTLGLASSLVDCLKPYEEYLGSRYPLIYEFWCYIGAWVKFRYSRLQGEEEEFKAAQNFLDYFIQLDTKRSQLEPHSIFLNAERIHYNAARSIIKHSKRKKKRTLLSETAKIEAIKLYAEAILIAELQECVEIAALASMTIMGILFKASGSETLDTAFRELAIRLCNDWGAYRKVAELKKSKEEDYHVNKSDHLNVDVLNMIRKLARGLHRRTLNQCKHITTEIITRYRTHSELLADALDQILNSYSFAEEAPQMQAPPPPTVDSKSTHSTSDMLAENSNSKFNTSWSELEVDQSSSIIKFVSFLEDLAAFISDSVEHQIFVVGTPSISYIRVPNLRTFRIFITFLIMGFYNYVAKDDLYVIPFVTRSTPPSSNNKATIVLQISSHELTHDFDKPLDTTNLNLCSKIPQGIQQLLSSVEQTMQELGAQQALYATRSGNHYVYKVTFEAETISKDKTAAMISQDQNRIRLLRHYCSQLGYGFQQFNHIPQSIIDSRLSFSAIFIDSPEKIMNCDNNAKVLAELKKEKPATKIIALGNVPSTVSFVFTHTLPFHIKQSEILTVLMEE